MQWAAGHTLGPYELVARASAQGKRLDARSDLFSFGAVLYEILSGARAFDGASIADTLSAVLRDEPRPLSAPGRLTAIVARCLRKSPADRFATTGELRTALQQALTADRPAVPSVVVLAFANMSRDPDDEYFGDGLAEEICAPFPVMRPLRESPRWARLARLMNLPGA